MLQVFAEAQPATAVLFASCPPVVKPNVLFALRSFGTNRASVICSKLGPQAGMSVCSTFAVLCALWTCRHATLIQHHSQTRPSQACETLQKDWSCGKAACSLFSASAVCLSQQTCWLLMLSGKLRRLDHNTQADDLIGTG